MGRTGKRLDARLRAVAEMVPPGSRVVDVGTDHGRLVRALVATGRAAYCLATELDPGRLATLRLFPPGHPLRERIALRSGYGLRPIRPEDRIEVAVLAGIGPRKLRRILDDPTRERLDLRRLVLQPQGDPADLRRWIRDHGMHVADERMVCLRGRFYTVIAAEPGRSTETVDRSEGEDLWEAGPGLTGAPDATAARYWMAQERRLAAILAGPGAGPGKDRARRALERARRILGTVERGTGARPGPLL